MNPIDKNYLFLQFKNKIYSKNGNNFQSFFESIMEKAYSDFQKIKPYGNQGDGGNDGYRKNSGVYYQVYAPHSPSIKEAEAARKIKKDFKKLKNNWNEISEIKEYSFVFNDKYSGSIQKLESTISELKEDNPTIRFTLFLAKDLEEVFFKLNKTDILNLGFNIDSRKIISLTYKYLEDIKVELDKENTELALKMLENNQSIISNLKDEEFSFKDENMSLESELLECRCLKQLEEVEKAKEKYDNLSKRFPNDPRSFLYLADIYLKNGKLEENKELLKKAEEINNNHWLLKLEKLNRKMYLGEEVNTEAIDENEFPEDPRLKAKFYRIYSIFIEKYGNATMADSFVEKAIYFNPDEIKNYLAKLLVIEIRILSIQDNFKKAEKIQMLLEEIKKINNKFSEFGDIRERNKAFLYIKKLKIFSLQKNQKDFKKIGKKTFQLLLNCYFDKQIDNLFVNLLMFVKMSKKDLNKLLDYIKQSEKTISNKLTEKLIIQFDYRNDLKDFLREINKEDYFAFVENIENRKYEKVLNFLKNNTQFKIEIAQSTKYSFELRKKIIKELPDNENNQNDRLLLLLNYDENNFDKAFKILKNIGLYNLNYIECKIALKVTQAKQAWDDQIIILEKLLEEEKKLEVIFDYKLKLFQANLNLEKHLEVIRIGKEILEMDKKNSLLSLQNKRSVLSQVINSALKRGKFKQAKQLLNKYSISKYNFEFKVGVEAKVHLENSEPQKALESVIEGIKLKKILSPEEYAKLYYLVIIRIGNLIDFNLESLNKVKENTFVKFKNKDDWYFIGNDNELDAIKIHKSKDKYSFFINKKVNETIIFENKYSSKNREEIVDKIFSIKKYVIWNIIKSFNKLSSNNILDGVQMIEFPKKEEDIDFKYLSSFLEDLRKPKKPFFDMYCEKTLPLAMLAVNEGGITNAIGRIKKEKRGFINFSKRFTEELENQKIIARKVINEKLSFYLDGTSALILSERGMLKKIYSYLPNLKVTQSVINLLSDVAEKFRDIPGQVGNMGYAKGEITFSSAGKDEKEKIYSNFIKSIELLESKPENIDAISSANKIDCFSEQEIPSELSDACILSQKKNTPILTEDFLYLKMNESETNKNAPKYFSSLILLKVLYEKDKITFDEYLDFFAYLSSYRFRFLPLSSKDIKKAVLGDKKRKEIKPKNIRKFNFSLTLSKEYGISFRKAFSLVCNFFVEVLINERVKLDVLKEIFIEIIETFPTEKEKKEFGKLLLNSCIEIIKYYNLETVFDLKNENIKKKISNLLEMNKEND